MGGTADHLPELLGRLSEYPVAGCFEDPLPGEDVDGYIELRQRCARPILLHHFPTGATHEVLRRPADGYILGHSRIGDAARRAGLFAAGSMPFSLQNVGGHITRAMTLHMMAAFPSASLHFNSDTETWASDVVNERWEPVNGLLRVPEAPGLGVTLDREALERLSRQSLPPQKPWIVKTTFQSGARLYCRHDPDDSIFLVRPDRRREFTPSWVSPVTTEYWDDDGSPAFREMMGRLQTDGMVLER
jgi:hypothetical protein